MHCGCSGGHVRNVESGPCRWLNIAAGTTRHGARPHDQSRRVRRAGGCVSVRVAYADPPYPGEAKRHYKDHPDFDGEVDHVHLLEHLHNEFPDGWALSTKTPSLRDLLPLCADDVRVGAWVKPWASFKPGVGIKYAWEPVLWRGGRKRGKHDGFTRDWVAANAVMRDEPGTVHTKGKKPETFCFWLFALLNLRPGDDFVDLFPGSGAVGRSWQRWQRQLFTDVAV